MKTKPLLIGLSLILLLINGLFAQNKCCLNSTVAPEVMVNLNTGVVGLNQNTIPPTLAISASSDLPNVEYLITKRGTAALNNQGQPDTTGGGGDVVLGTDADGTFIPTNITRYNIDFSVGDTLDLIAIGYDLAIVQQLTDSLLNGYSGSSPCCDLFTLLSIALQQPSLAGFCDTLNNAGIYTGSDVTSFEEVLVVLGVFVDGQLSVESIISIFQLLNTNGTFISADCGGVGANNFIPYGIHPNKRYGYQIGNMVDLCCLGTTVAPELAVGVHGTPIESNQNTPTPVLTVNASADLPNVEYLITKRGTVALDNQGQMDTTGAEVVIGADVDGIFMPMDKSRYGIQLAVGDTFDLVAIGYDLGTLEVLMDSLLNGDNGGQPCCGVFSLIATAANAPFLAGLCDSLNNKGIYTANDFNNLEEALPIFEAFGDGQASVKTIVETLELLNDNGNLISSDCGGLGTVDFLPYGINRAKRYSYIVDHPLVVRTLSDVSLFMLYPNPAKAAAVTVYFTTSKTIDLSIKVFNTLGECVHSQTLGNVLGDFTTTIPIRDFASGMYFIELTDGHNSQAQRLLVD
ncbi:T9SS type A sorting domain-containing protein [Aureispira anguillae]|uniref:T9SS type A sorting domain-containing protein n=1 Tax=Aureispira anguillae TaxID=2864201 RepID=A0A915YET3_9BACT|nr:T9SS type A sorting domain-containing protein [Aureispira anguillae]BDS11715.1 T9SS type A sorting domain-containing protein [Aureispira anguillae]